MDTDFLEEENKQYADTKLKSIIQPMVAQILLKEPDDVRVFMLDWLKKTYTRAMRRHETEGGSFDDDIEEDAPMPRSSKRADARKGVSAEAYGTWNRKEDFKPRVIEKTQEQIEDIRAKLKALFIFCALEPKELDIVIDAMEEKKFYRDDPVIKQGDEGNELYVVDSGTLECTRSFKKGEKPKFLKNYFPGEAFGELALLYNAPRAATIVANEECVLWCLDRATFNNIVKDSSVKKREKYEGFFKSVEIFSSIEPYELTTVIDAIKVARHKEGSIIIKEGDEGDVFYLLESGEAYATKCLEPDSDPTKVLEYKKGDYFGELALMKNAPRAASVFAKTDCVCLTLDRDSFQRLLGPLEDILKRNAKVYKEFTERMQ